MAEAGFVPPTPPIGKGPLPDLGTAWVPPERYHSAGFAAAEWANLWKKVWNLGVRESELAEPGDYVRHSIGKEDLIFVRGDDGVVRGHYNVCRHRGNQLCQGGREGHVGQFHCPYHGWRWNRDGSLAHVADLHSFRNSGTQGCRKACWTSIRCGSNAGRAGSGSAWIRMRRRWPIIWAM